MGVLGERGFGVGVLGEGVESGCLGGRFLNR